MAIRSKTFGIWDESTWAELWDLVETVAHGLLALGVDPGDRVSIHCEGRPEWIVVDLATVAVRGTSVGMHPANSPSELGDILADCLPKLHIAEDQEQVDKALDGDQAGLEDVANIIYLEPRGLNDYDDDRLLFWDEFLTIGRQHRTEHSQAVADRMQEATPDDVITLVYGEDTTGPSKGAMLTNTNVSFCIEKLINAENRLPGKPLSGKDQILTYLPLCHIGERVFSAWTLVGAGPVLNFAESIDLVNENLREVQPTIFFGVPGIWERLHATIITKANDASWFKKRVLNAGLAVARFSGGQRAGNGGDHTVASRLASTIFFPLVFRPLRDRIGLRRVRYGIASGGPSSPEVLQFFLGLGVPIYDVYGMTENVKTATSNFVGRMKLGTAGEPQPGIDFRIDDRTGEIQTRHDGVFAGYWNNPDATAAALTDDGWLKSGDIGKWVDDTHVQIVDRDIPDGDRS